MHSKTAGVVILFSSLSLLASVATLGVIGYGALKIKEELQQAKTQIEDIRGKTNQSLKTVKIALDNLEV